MQTIHPELTACGPSPAPIGASERTFMAIAIVLTGLSAGFFFTYQVSVIRGLTIVDDTTYVSTFQAINSTIKNGWFGLVFFGAVPALVAALATSWRQHHLSRWAIAAALISYLAVVAITFGGHIPLNDELAKAATTPDEARIARTNFEASWNSLHLARTLLAVVSLVCLAAATSSRSLTTRLS